MRRKTGLSVVNRRMIVAAAAAERCGDEAEEDGLTSWR